MITEQTMTQLRTIVARYPSARSAMLPCLHRVQEVEGYVTPEGMLAVADVLGVKPDEVESVVSFYSMYTQRPRGKHLVKVCTSISCYLRGCDDLLARLEAQLGIARGETTPDGRITLEAVECLAACGMAPVLQVNDAFVENVTPALADTLVERLTHDDAADFTPHNTWDIIGDGAGYRSRTTLDGAAATGAEAQHKGAQ